MKTTLVSYLVLAFAFTAIAHAQSCPKDSHLSGEICCPDGSDWQESKDGSHGTCCPDGMTYRYGTKPRGTCCPAEYPEYDEDANQCVATWTVTEDWWVSYYAKWFQINGKWVQIRDGGFLIDGTFHKYETGGISIGGTSITITQGGIMVGGEIVSITSTRPGQGQGQNSIQGHGSAGVRPQKPVSPEKPAEHVSEGHSGVPPQKPTSPEKPAKPVSGGNDGVPPCHSQDTPSDEDKPVKPSTDLPEPPVGPDPVKPGPNRPEGGQKVPQASVGNCGCSTQSPCPTDEHLGIQYGKCYTLIDVNGLPLNRETGGVYQSGGDIGNLIFRVCKSTTDCSGDQDTPVPQHDGKFYLQDQIGWKDWEGPAWFANNWPHFNIDRANKAVQFAGEGMCLYGHPSICLRDGEKARGMAAPCPLGGNAAMSHIYYTKNPNSCKAYRFVEAKCLSKSVEEKN